MLDQNSHKDIAIIGMSCRFPGAKSTKEYWNLLTRGEKQIKNMPSDRLAQFDYSAVKTLKGSFLEDVYDFDPAYFGIPEIEAQILDPQHRLMLELVEEAKLDAGWKKFNNDLVSVFLGANQRGYADAIQSTYFRSQIMEKVAQINVLERLPSDLKEEFLEELKKIASIPDVHPSTITGNLSNMVAGRISHEFNLKGPSLSIDTACSSSLVAVHLACESLKSGESDIALAGGVNLNLSPSIYILMEGAGVISASGKIDPFSEHSDGILLGEGAGLLVLKRLKDALEDKDRILAVIKGSGMNNDGHSLGVMTPAWKGQLSLLENVYESAQYDRNKISYIEAHGTSTRIGDSVEVTVLKSFFKDKKGLAVGSSKYNLGHMLGAAGMAGLIKVILSIQHKKLLPSIEQGKVNPKWRLNEFGIRIQDRMEEWESEGLRSAGVSAFGFGGTNAHIIVEESINKTDLPEKRNFPEPIFERRYLGFDLFPELDQSTDHFYGLDWKERKDDYEQNTEIPAEFILFCDQFIYEILSAKPYFSKNAIFIIPDDSFSRLDENLFSMNPANKDHPRWFFEWLNIENKSFSILFMTRALLQGKEMPPEDLMIFFKHFLNESFAHQSIKAFYLASKNVFRIEGNEKVVALERSLYTLFNVAFNENSHIQGGAIDMDDYSSFEDNYFMTSFPFKMNKGIHYRNGKFYERDFLPFSGSNGQNNGIQIENGKNYLIIGGSSGIGEELTKHIKINYNVKLLITGRRREDELSKEIRSQLGDGLIYVSCHVEEAGEVRGLVNTCLKHFDHIDGIIYAAGKRAFSSTVTMDDDVFREVLLPKMTGILNVLEAIGSIKVDFIYLMSSISASSPELGKGMGAYAAANAFLDALSVQEGREGLKLMSRAWTMWQNTGMSGNIDLTNKEGIEGLPLSKGLSLFVESLLVPSAYSLVLGEQDIHFVDDRYAERKIKDIRKKDIPENTDIQKEEAGHQSGRKDVFSLLSQLIAKELDIPVEEIDPDESFSEMGLDSISALDMAGVIEKEYDISLDPTLLFEYDSISSLSAYLDNELGGENAQAYPVLDTQKVFFTHQMIHPNGALNTLLRMDMLRNFDTGTLQKSIEILINQHDSLRSTFKMNDDGLEMYLENEPNFILKQKLVDGDKDMLHSIQQIENELLEKIYDLSVFPLFDMVYIEKSQHTSTLLINLHHIITDAWSMSIILKDLFRIYDDIEDGKESKANLGRSLVKYVQHIEKQEKKIDPKGTKYWKEEMAGFRSFHLSPEMIVHQAISSFPRTHSIQIEKFRVEQMDIKSKESKLSIFQLLISYLYRALVDLTGQDDLLLRIAIENRDRGFKDYQQVTGCLADAVPLRLNSLHDKNSIELAKIIGEKIRKAYMHYESSAAGLSMLNKNNAEGNIDPIAPIGISYINADQFLKDFDKGYWLSNRVQLSFSLLSLIFVQQKGKLLAHLNYDRSKLNEHFVEQLADKFKEVVEKDLNKEAKVFREHAMNILEIPGKELFPAAKTMEGKLLLACEKYSKRTAVFEEKSFTYSILKEKAILLATKIQNLNEIKGELIAILAYPGFEAIKSIFAIHLAGFAYLPLDPDWPNERIKQIMEHAGVETLLSTKKHETKIKESGAIEESVSNIIFTDEIDEENGIEFRPAERKPSDLAYVMYTSGTTGNPKGVDVTHESLGHFLNWISEEFKIHQEDRFIQSSSLGFGGSLRQMFSTLLAGACMYPIDRYDFKDMESLTKYMDKHRISILNTVPSVLQSMSEYLETMGNQSIDLSSLRLVLVGGEALHGKVVKKWYKKLNHKHQLINLYGSTETIVNATFYEVKEGSSLVDTVSIGKARKGSHVILLNDQDEECRKGEKGEILVGGPSIARGYFKEEELTKEKFVELDFPACNGKYYKTGDIAYRDQDGLYHFVGRNDEQFQLYGNRIEASEIENAILSMKEVRQVAVFDRIWKDQHQIVACIEISDPEIKIESVDIRAHILETLPMYMVPHVVEFVDKFPMNHAGKVDKNLLKKHFQLASGETSKLPFKKTKTEELILNLWKKALKTENIDLDIDFFALGADSIMALQILHKLRKYFKKSPKAIDLFRYRTVRKLASLIDELNGEFQGDPEDKLVDAVIHSNHPMKKIYALSEAQKGFYMMHQLYPEKAPNLALLLPVKGKFSVDAFEKAFNKLIEKHPILRTTYFRENLVVRQEIQNEGILEVEYVDLTKQKADNEKWIDDIYSDLKNKQFKLDVWPLFAVKVLKLDQQKHILGMSMHHICGDAWSFQLLINDLLKYYDEILNSTEAPAEEVDMSFFSYIEQIDIQNAEISVQLKDDLAYWDKIFKLYNQSRWYDNCLEEGHGSSSLLTLTPHHLLKMREYCQLNRMSLFQLLFALYAQSLAEYFQVDNLMINTALSGRDKSSVGTDQMVGCFAQNLPVFLKDIARENEKGIDYVSKMFYEANSHSSIGAGELMKLFAKNTDAHIKDLFRFYFSYMDFSSIDQYQSENLKMKWTEASYHFSSSGVNSGLFMALRIMDGVQINLGGQATREVKDGVLSVFEKKINGILPEMTPSFSSALIAYLPSKKTLLDVFPSAEMGEKLIGLIKKKLFRSDEAALLEVLETELGRSAVFMLPYFAEDINKLPKETLLHNISKVILRARALGAKNVSLAGNLPSRLNYALALRKYLTKNYGELDDLELTTGHSTTVVAVVKTIEKLLKLTQLDLSSLCVGVAGFGSIGQSSLSLMMEKLGLPAQVLIADLDSQHKALQAKLDKLEKKLGQSVLFCPVKKVLPDSFYQADLIIGASSTANILNVNKLKPGCILVDDSFPPIANQNKALQRMKSKQDVLIVGGGKLKTQKSERVYLPGEISENLLFQVVDKFGDEGLPGCRLEPMLRNVESNLAPTIGLVSPQLALEYWDKILDLEIEAVKLHLGSHLIGEENLEKVKSIVQKKNQKLLAKPL